MKGSSLVDVCFILGFSFCSLFLNFSDITLTKAKGGKGIIILVQMSIIGCDYGQQSLCIYAVVVH